MKTLNTSSGDYTAIFHSLSAYDAQHKVTVYDIFLGRHIFTKYTNGEWLSELLSAIRSLTL